MIYRMYSCIYGCSVFLKCSFNWKYDSFFLFFGKKWDFFMLIIKYGNIRFVIMYFVFWLMNYKDNI